MKKYTQPELSISMFDIEDVITASGEVTTMGNIAQELGGKLFTDAELTTEAAENTAAMYLGWTE